MNISKSTLWLSVLIAILVLLVVVQLAACRSPILVSEAVPLEAVPMVAEHRRVEEQATLLMEACRLVMVASERPMAEILGRPMAEIRPLMVPMAEIRP